MRPLYYSVHTCTFIHQHLHAYTIPSRGNFTEPRVSHVRTSHVVRSFSCALCTWTTWIPHSSHTWPMWLPRMLHASTIHEGCIMCSIHVWFSRAPHESHTWLIAVIQCSTCTCSYSCSPTACLAVVQYKWVWVSLGSYKHSKCVVRQSQWLTLDKKKPPCRSIVRACSKTDHN